MPRVDVTSPCQHGLVRQTPRPYLEQLRAELNEIRLELDALLDHSSIRNVNPNTDDSGIFFVGAADWGWTPSDAATSAIQMHLIARYDAWFERFRLLFPHATPDIDSKIESGDDFMRLWTKRPDTWDHSIPRTIEEAKARTAEELAVFGALLDIAAASGDSTMRLVPDTNSLIRNPDLASYARTAPESTFVVHLLPTVLSELDELKDRGRTEDLRKQAQAVIRRLKGLRDHGNLSTGVNLTKAITVRADAREVDVRAVLDWLDPTVPDDRILAAALRLQSDHPGGHVIVVTSDLNLQNKADAVGLPYMETPPATASLRADLSAMLEWPSATGPPVLTLANAGPAVGRHISYSVATPPQLPPPHFRAGPWEVPQLRPGDVDRQEVYGAFPDVVLVTAAWTDDDGTHDLSWTIDFPARPASKPVVRRVR